MTFFFRSSKSYRHALFRCQEAKCFYCGEPMKLSKRGSHGMYATVDHVFPRSRPDLRMGPAALMRNKVLACRRCNETKADRPPTPDEVARLRELEFQVQMAFSNFEGDRDVD